MTDLKLDFPNSNFFEQDSGVKYVNFKEKNRLANFTIEGTSVTGIIVNEYGHSILVEIANDKDHEKLEALQSCLENSSEKFTHKPLMNDGKIFFKLPHKDGKYNFLIDPPISPKNHERAEIYNGSEISITLSPKAFFNFDDEKSGIFFKITKIIVDGGKKQSRRK